MPIIEKRKADILIYPKLINSKKINKNTIESKVCGYNNLMKLIIFKSDCKDFK